MAYHLDKSCFFPSLPRELLISIILFGSWFTLYIRPFDGLGVLNYIRESSNFAQIERESIIDFNVGKDMNGTYFVMSDTGQKVFNAPQSRSLEILGQGTPPKK